MHLLEATKSARLALKKYGFKKGDYRIENCLHHYRGSGKEYGRTLIHMRKEVSENLLSEMSKDGIYVYVSGNIPILAFS